MILCKVGNVYHMTQHNIPEDLNLQWQLHILQMDGYLFAKFPNYFYCIQSTLLPQVHRKEETFIAVLQEIHLIGINCAFMLSDEGSIFILPLNISNIKLISFKITYICYIYLDRF